MKKTQGKNFNTPFEKARDRRAFVQRCFDQIEPYYASLGPRKLRKKAAELGVLPGLDFLD